MAALKMACGTLEGVHGATPARALARVPPWQASLSKPAELNPPAAKQEEFARKFGVTWKAALAEGKCYNAVDGCKRLGINGEKMDQVWASAKKVGRRVGATHGRRARRCARTARGSGAVTRRLCLQACTGPGADCLLHTPAAALELLSPHTPQTTPPRRTRRT